MTDLRPAIRVLGERYRYCTNNLYKLDYEEQWIEALQIEGAIELLQKEQKAMKEIVNARTT